MTYAAGQASPNDPSILHAAIGLAPQIRDAADETEQTGGVPRVEDLAFGQPQ